MSQVFHLTEPDQHGCIRLMSGEIQLAYINPDGVKIFQRWMDLCQNVELYLENGALQRETFKGLVETMSGHRCSDQAMENWKRQQKLQEDKQILRTRADRLQKEVFEQKTLIDKLTGVLEEFVTDVNLAGLESTRETWPDLADTYGRSVDTLKEAGVLVEDQREVD